MNPNRIENVIKFLRRRPPKDQPLARERDQFHILVEQSSDGIMVTNADWTLLDVNTSGCLMFGYERAELKRRSFGELLAGEDLPKLELIDKALRTGDSVLCSLNCRRRGDCTFYAQVNISPLMDGRIQLVLRDMTQKGKMRAILEARDACYRAIVEDQTEFIRRFKPELTLTYVNPAFCKYFGKDQFELLGKSFLELVPEEDHDHVLQQIQDLCQAHPVAVAERRFVRPDGEVHWQQWVNRAIFDDSGNIIEYQSVGRDITEQKQIERRLQESEARYRAIVEDQTEFIRRFKPDLTLTYVNPAFCRYFHKNQFELLGKSFLNLLPEEDHALVRRQIEALGLAQPVGVVERRVVLSNGETRWQQWVNRAIFDDDGEVVEYQSVGRDMTAHRLMEQKLKESESRYRAIVEDQTDLIRRFKPDGTLTFVNSAFCRFYQKDVSEILGINFESLIPPQEREQIANQIYSLTLAEPTCITEPRYFKPDGSVSWVQYVNRAIFDDKGDVLEYQSVGRDITLQKEAETKLQEAREAIERATRVTTLAVIGGGIAHEINQPLNALKILVGTVSYLAKTAGGRIPDMISETFMNIAEQVDRIDSIVNHLRLFLRQSQTFEYTPCDLNTIVETALTLVANQVFSKKIRIKKLLTSPLPPICGSSVRFEEVVLNLIMNAVDALEPIEKRRKITIRTWAEDDSVHLDVIDNGHGVDPAVADKMFEPFFSTKKQGCNMGLGLSIVHSIVAASNGTIRIENQPGGGTIVAVSLPAARGETDQEPEGSCRSDVVIGAEIAGGGLG
ncbi:MAG: PAS domain S-box protein [Solidesulfovibrio sp.]